jgi:hypothetical protein
MSNAAPSHTMSEMAKKAVVVVGMHRSGTSAVMRVLNLLGVELGNSFFPPNPANVKGFWEHAEIVAVHDRLLRALGSHWQDYRPLPEEWWQSDAVEPYRQELIQILRRDFAQTPLFGLKDPRICRLLPLWNRLFTEIECNPFYVFILRHPDEVAASLLKRDGMFSSKTRVLWLDHLLTAEMDTRECSRVFVSYERLLDDWQDTVRRIAQAGGIQWPRSIESATGEIADFLESDLRHHRSAEDRPEAANGTSWVASAYREAKVFAKDAENETGRQTIKELKLRLQGAIQLFEPLVSQQERKIGELSKSLEEQSKEFTTRLGERDHQLAEQERRLSGEIAQLRAKLSDVSAERDVLLHSRSWRVTAPLRRVGKLVRRVSGALEPD